MPRAGFLAEEHTDVGQSLRWLGINNARAEGLNSVVRLIITRARGFHSPEAALALVMLTCGPITLLLPHEHPG